MTEKRFISIGGSLYDTTKAITDGECMGVFIDRSECENVCNLLNEQYIRIKELEKENEKLKIDIMGQSEEIEILSDENKRLKQGKYVYGIRGGSNDRK